MTDVGRTMSEEETERALTRSVEAAYRAPTQTVRGQPPFTTTTFSAIIEMNRLAHEIRDNAEQDAMDAEDAITGNNAAIDRMLREHGLRRDQLPQNIQDMLRGVASGDAAGTTSPTADPLSHQLETEWVRLKAFLPDNIEGQFLREFLDSHGLQRNGTSWSANLQDQNTIGDHDSYVPIIALPSDERGRGGR